MAAINKVLASGGATNIIFHDFLDCREDLSLVSKAFRGANKKAMQRMEERIQMCDRAFTDRLGIDTKRFCGSSTPQVALDAKFRDVSTRVSFLLPRLREPRAIPLTIWWDRIMQMRTRCLNENGNQEKSRLIGRLVIHLSAMQEQLAPLELDPSIMFDWRIGEVAGENNPFYILIEGLKNFVAEESVAQRFKEVVARPQTNPGKPVESLVELRKAQAAANPRAAEQFAQLDPHSFSLENLRGAEALALEGEFERDRNLCMLWERIRRIIGVGLEAGAPVSVIRDWINDRNNADNLERIWRLSSRWSMLGELSSLPPEIENLSNLRALQIGGTFQEIPQIAARLPNLVYLSITNETPFRQLPEEFAGWSITADEISLSFGPDRVWNQFQRLGFPLPWNCREIEIDRSQLTDIPFSVWFRETFFIPNIPFMLCLPLLFPLLLGLALLEDYGDLTIFVIGLPFAIPALIIGLPIALLNAFIHYAIGPLVEEIRNELYRDEPGYNGMVHIRDLPEEPAAAPVAQEVGG